MEKQSQLFLICHSKEPFETFTERLKIKVQNMKAAETL